MVFLPVPPGATSGTLRLPDAEPVEEHLIAFGKLNPVTDVSGVQQRLTNLGFTCRVTGEVDDPTTESIARFQSQHELDGGGALDDATRDKLAEVHGS